MVLILSRFRKFFGTRVVALFVVADHLTPVLLGDLLGQEGCLALRALLRNRAVPEHEIAVRIVRAAEERLAPFRLALDDLAALVGVFRALDTSRLVLDVLALRVLGARSELALAPLLDDQVGAAARTQLFEDLIRLRGAQASLLGRNELPRRLALRIARARQELAETSAFDRHRLAAVLARFNF